MGERPSYTIRGLLGAAAIVAIGVLLAQSVARPESPAGDTVDVSSVWSGKDVRSLSSSFNGGDVLAVMGGLDLDLRDATMAGDEAVLEVFVMWGALNLRVPEDWRVAQDVDSLFAGIEDRTVAPPEGAAKVLVLRGTVLMGGIEIR